MTLTIICSFHDGAKMLIAPYLYRYPGIFLPVLGGACYYTPGKNKLYDSMQKDNDGENISPLTVYINEHSHIYWAYKNYNKIGNPDMIGLCHYRRMFDIDYNNLDPSKIYANRVQASHAGGFVAFYPDTVEGTYCNFCSDEHVEFYLDMFRYYLPDYIQDVDLVMNDHKYYARNMFIMSRTNFFEFMSYVVRVLRIFFDDKIFKEACSIFYPDVHIRQQMLTKSRCRGFLMEMFTAVWFERQNRINGNVVHVPVFEFK